MNTKMVICPISMASEKAKECDPRCAMNENGYCALWSMAHDISVLENKVHTNKYGHIQVEVKV